MANPHGTPIWYEYLAKDADEAQAFYVKVNGWRVDASVIPGVDYRLLTAPDGSNVGALMTLPTGADTAGLDRLFGVDHVDAAVSQVEAVGGRVHMPATTMARIGRMAFLRAGARHRCCGGACDADGGSVLRGPDRIPGGDYSLDAEDPFGARVGLVGPRP